MKQCIYCLRSDRQFSLEHIWPDKLGGNLTDESLRTNDVCVVCNSLCGLYVDGPFIKNFFIKNDYLHIGTTYTFLGQLDLPSLNDWVCDYWIGKRGMVFHLFPREKDFLTYIGGDPRQTKKHSRAYLYLAPQSDEEACVSISEFIKEFKKANCYAGNFEPDQTMPTKIKPLPQNDPLVTLEIEAIQTYAKKNNDLTIKVKNTIKLGFEDRFIAKLSLGLGYKLLGNQYITTESAKLLRKFLWESDPVKRATMPVKGQGYTFESEQIAKYLSVSNSWTIGIIGVGESLGITVVTPGQKMMCMTISEELSLWKDLNFKPYLDGILNIINPRAQKVELGLNLIEFITKQSTLQ